MGIFAYLSFGCYEMVDNGGIRLLVKSESCTQSYEVKLRISSNKCMAQNSRQKYSACTDDILNISGLISRKWVHFLITPLTRLKK